MSKMSKKKKTEDLVATCLELKFQIVTPKDETDDVLKTFNEIIVKACEALKKRTNAEIENKTCETEDET